MTQLSNDLELLELVGQGGMADVYRARLTGPGGFTKVVAVKKVNSVLANDPAFQELFFREARLLAKLSHPNIVQVFQVREFEGTPYLVLEWIEGVTLKRLSDPSATAASPLSDAVAISILNGILEALVAAHEFRDPDSGQPARIIHRDLSPHNVMVDVNGNTKVLDFGVAKVMGVGRDATLTTSITGKYAYLAPEAAIGGAIDERSDLFSLGIIAFELLTGRPLFKGQSDLETLEQVKSAKIPQVGDLRKAVSADLNGFVATLLRRVPSERYASARAAHAALRAISSDKLASTDDLKQLVGNAKVGGIRLSSSTVTDPKPAVVTGRTSRSTRMYAYSVTLLMTLIICGGTAYRFARRPTSLDSAPMRIIWERDGNLVDLSPPPLEYHSFGEQVPESLDSSACFHLCTHLGTQVHFFLSDEIATKNDRTAGYTPAAKFFSQITTQIARNRDFLSKTWKTCNRLAYCASAENLHGGFIDILPSIDLKTISNYKSLRDAVAFAKTPFWNHEKIAAYLNNPDRQLSKKWVDDEKILDSSELFRTSPLTGLDIITVSESQFPATTNDCIALGDLFVARNSGLSRGLDVWELKNTALVIFPKGTSIQVLGSRGSDLILSIPDGESDLVFKKGVCQYRRTNSLLEVARHWIPRTSARTQ